VRQHTSVNRAIHAESVAKKAVIVAASRVVLYPTVAETQAERSSH
jgi:hypothetical protein